MYRPDFSQQGTEVNLITIFNFCWLIL